MSSAESAERPMVASMFTIAEGHRVVGVQLPIQARSSYFVAPWELDAGPVELQRVAKTCDRSGIDYVGVCDHVAVPAELASSMSTYWMDPISTLSWIAGFTTSVRLLTHVYVLPYRHPLVAAKQFATLDHLSGGRLIVGIGAGHALGEFERLGVDFARRGAITNESLPVLAEALASEFVDGVGATPRPTQHPRPPIWVAGSSAAAITRAARFGDGWLPQSPTTDEHVAALDQALAVVGRGREGFAVGHIAPSVYVGTPTWDVGSGVVAGSGRDVAEQLAAKMPTAVNQVQVRFAARDVSEYCDQVELFGAEAAALLRQVN